MTTHTPTVNRARSTALATWTAIVVSSVVVIVLLHRLGSTASFAVDWSDPVAWLDDHAAERVVLAAGRLVALALAYWLAGSTILYTLAKATRIPALIRSVEWMTLPSVRKVAERVVAVSLTVSSLSAGGVGAALAAEQSVPDAEPPLAVHLNSDAPVDRYVPVPAGDTPITIPVPTADDGYTPIPAGDEATIVIPPPPFALRGDGPVIRGAATPDDGASVLFDPAAAELTATAELRLAGNSYEYTVVSGDNLWTTAEAHLAAVVGRAPSDAETATYWSHMIEVNRPNLRSGDPDLIFPGEIVVCPPTTDVGIGS